MRRSVPASAANLATADSPIRQFRMLSPGGKSSEFKVAPIVQHENQIHQTSSSKLQSIPSTNNEEDKETYIVRKETSELHKESQLMHRNQLIQDLS